MAERWRLRGTLFDACNCVILCPCNYAQLPTQEHCRAAAVWHVTKGHYGRTSLNGLNFAGIIYARANPLFGIDRATILVDAKATGPKREALMTVLSGRAGGFWELMAKATKSPPQVLDATIRYSNNGRTWSVEAGDCLGIRAAYLHPPPEMGMKLPPRKVQTFDSLFSPTMRRSSGSRNRTARTQATSCTTSAGGTLRPAGSTIGARDPPGA